MPGECRGFLKNEEVRKRQLSYGRSILEDLRLAEAAGVVFPEPEVEVLLVQLVLLFSLFGEERWLQRRG
jgi:hypothetical protein